MGKFKSFRKVYGALKDFTKVGLAKVNSELKDLDIAIVKATNHSECPPKEPHVRKIILATSSVVPRADVAYCIHALYRRLSKTRNWIVAIKTLIVFHRTLREGDPSFREELLNYSERGLVFLTSNFKDDSSTLAWDCSTWVRTYGMYLEERLECFRMLKYDIESENLTRRAPGKGYSSTRLMRSEELLEQLPAMQQLLYRLIRCQPEGAAYHNYLVQYALALVLKESFKIYCSINDGIINVVDLFFDMPKHEAEKALMIYKKAGKQAEHLAGFYEFCRHLDLARNFQFPTLRQPPPSFLATMEEYIREAPTIVSFPIKRLEYKDVEEDQSGDSVSLKNDDEQIEDKQLITVEHEHEPEPEPQPEFESKKDKDIPPLISANNCNDLLGLNQIIPQANELDQTNARALSIVQNDRNPQSSSVDWNEMAKKPGWELALVEHKINTTNNTSQAKLGGGFDKFLLDSLYEDDAARRQMLLPNAGYNTSNISDMQYNPFGQQPTPQPLQNPFMMSSIIPPPMNVQMMILHPQQQQMTMKQQQQQQPYQNHYLQLYGQPYQLQNMLIPYNNRHPMGTSNPFGDIYENHQRSIISQGNHGLI